MVELVEGSDTNPRQVDGAGLDVVDDPGLVGRISGRPEFVELDADRATGAPGDIVGEFDELGSRRSAERELELHRLHVALSAGLVRGRPAAGAEEERRRASSDRTPDACSTAPGHRDPPPSASGPIVRALGASLHPGSTADFRGLSLNRRERAHPGPRITKCATMTPCGYGSSSAARLSSDRAQCRWR